MAGPLYKAVAEIARKRETNLSYRRVKLDVRSKDVSAVCGIAQVKGEGHVANAYTSNVEYVIKLNLDSSRLDREFGA